MQAIRTVTNVKARQTKKQNEGLEIIENMIEENNLLDHKVLLFLMEPGVIDRNIAGLIANKMMAKYQRPVCILTKGENGYQGSARGCTLAGIPDFKAICE
jgi:single-stranded DNA-specific DHH superfamily exonuclease